MSTTTPEKPPPAMSNTPTRGDMIRIVSWSALIVCPIVMLLPPRKLDMYTLGLLGGTFAAGNQISKEYTGVSMVERISSRANGFTESSLPPKALEVQKRLKEEKAWREMGETGRRELLEARRMEDVERKAGVLDEILKEKERKEAEKKGLLEKIWMGSEGEDWKAKRDQREKEAIQEGRGYGGLIIDQIWDVWNWGKDKNEEVKKIDEKVVGDKIAKNTEEKKR